MNEEKILEVLETVIRANRFDGVFTTVDVIIEAIQGLLDLYNKEKEKNKELYKDNQKQWAERCKLAIELDNNTISKDKIKDMQRYREFELQQEYKDFEKDVEWKTYNKILEEE